MLMINNYNTVYQLELSYYRLDMVPGYRVSHEDCEVPPPVLLTTLSNTLYLQVCGYTGGPLLLRATTLASIADSAVPRSLALLDLAIQVTALQCEDDLLDEGCRVWTPA